MHVMELKMSALCAFAALAILFVIIAGCAGTLPVSALTDATAGHAILPAGTD